MSRGALVRFLLVLGLLAGCAAIALGVKPNLGLDLRGGAQFVFQANDTETTEATATNVDKTVEVLRGRVDALGVAESTLVRQGDDRILVELPGVTNDDEAQEAEERIGQTAQLSVHPVVATANGPDAEPSEEGNEVLPAEDGQFLEIGPTALQGDEITGAEAVQRENSVGYAVAVDFSGSGSDAFGKLSGDAACAQGAPGGVVGSDDHEASGRAEQGVGPVSGRGGLGDGFRAGDPCGDEPADVSGHARPPRGGPGPRPRSAWPRSTPGGMRRSRPRRWRSAGSARAASR